MKQSLRHVYEASLWIKAPERTMRRPVYVNDHIRLALGKARQRDLIQQADKARLVKRTGPGLAARALESLRHRTTKRTRQGPIPLDLATTLLARAAAGNARPSRPRAGPRLAGRARGDRVRAPRARQRARRPLLAALLPGHRARGRRRA